MWRGCCVFMFGLLLSADGKTPKHARLPEVVQRFEDGPGFTADGKLRFPAEYREGVYLTSGLDMSYSPEAASSEPIAATRMNETMTHSMFDNVFVNATAYRAFKSTGVWPDGTVLVLEQRGAVGAASINKQGKTQTAEVMGLEVHVKDSVHIQDQGGWGFFSFEGEKSAQRIARPASCYTCHEQHAAVDTTFVQFYPTLLGIAQAKDTLSQAYKEEAAAQAAMK